MPRIANHPDGIQPVMKDGHYVCATCGKAVQPFDETRWRHVAPGRRFHGQSKFLEPKKEASPK